MSNASMSGKIGLRSLATRLGVTHPAIIKWMGDSTWTFGNGPWTERQVGQIHAWRQATLRPSGSDDGAVTNDGKKVTSEREANVRLKTVKTAREAFALQLAQGKVHDVAKCDSRNVRKVYAVKEKLLSIAPSMPPETPPHIREHVRQRCEQICNEFAAKKPGEG